MPTAMNEHAGMNTRWAQPTLLRLHPLTMVSSGRFVFDPAMPYDWASFLG